MPRRRLRPIFYELFYIYKIHRLILIEFGMVFLASGVMPFVERGHPDATILTLHQSLWWAMVTVTSTGYGDYVPVTGIGQIIGTVLMFSGIVLFSTMVALVASYFSYRRIKRNTIRTNRQIEDLAQVIDDLKIKINYLVKNGVEEVEKKRGKST